MISKLELNFTKYLLNKISDFKSKYSIRIYELMIKWKNNGKTKSYSVQELREMLGIDEKEYKTMSLFKTNVLDKALNEINKKSDLNISYEQFKDGRVITHIQFKIKQCEKIVKLKQPSLKSLTGKQIEMFSDKLSKLTEFQNHFVAPVGASSETYRQEIALKLKDSFYVKEWIDFLKIVGFKPEKFRE